jgi:AraC-like DNA-binding protein
MTYQELKPSKNLEHIVDSYWFFSSLEPVESEKILPDGCMDIIFNFGVLTNSIATNAVGVSGMMTTFSDKAFDKNTDLFGVRFKPGMLSKLTEFPLFEIKNKITEASIVIPELNIETVGQLKNLNNIDKRIQLIEREIINILYAKKPSNDALVISVIETLHSSPMPISIENIAKNHCISLRQLERKFKHQVGVTAKEYDRIVRFTKTKNNIKSQKNNSLLNIALQNGYFDHSHLTNEFKRFSGLTPSEFR